MSEAAPLWNPRCWIIINKGMMIEEGGEFSARAMHTPLCCAVVGK